MKRNAVIALVGIAALGLSTGALADTNANANTPASAQTVAGPYVGVQGGFGYVNEDLASGTSTDKSGFAVGGTAGYKINNNFAVQGDFMRYPSAKATLGGSTAKSERNYSIDLALKGILPFNSFNVYGLAGVAYVHEKTTCTGSSCVGGANATNHAFSPIFGAGVGYALTQNIEFDIQTTSTIKRKSQNIPQMIATTAGVSYYF